MPQAPNEDDPLRSGLIFRLSAAARAARHASPLSSTPQQQIRPKPERRAQAATPSSSILGSLPSLPASAVKHLVDSNPVPLAVRAASAAFRAAQRVGTSPPNDDQLPTRMIEAAESIYRDASASQGSVSLQPKASTPEHDPSVRRLFADEREDQENLEDYPPEQPEKIVRDTAKLSELDTESHVPKRSSLNGNLRAAGEGQFDAGNAVSAADLDPDFEVEFPSRDPVSFPGELEGDAGSKDKSSRVDQELDVKPGSADNVSASQSAELAVANSESHLSPVHEPFHDNHPDHPVVKTECAKQEVTQTTTRQYLTRRERRRGSLAEVFRLQKALETARWTNSIAVQAQSEVIVISETDEPSRTAKPERRARRIGIRSYDDVTRRRAKSEPTGTASRIKQISEENGEVEVAATRGGRASSEAKEDDVNKSSSRKRTSVGKSATRKRPRVMAPGSVSDSSKCANTTKPAAKKRRNTAEDTQRNGNPPAFHTRSSSRAAVGSKTQMQSTLQDSISDGKEVSLGLNTEEWGALIRGWVIECKAMRVGWQHLSVSEMHTLASGPFGLSDGMQEIVPDLEMSRLRRSQARQERLLRPPKRQVSDAERTESSGLSGEDFRINQNRSGGDVKIR